MDLDEATDRGRRSGISSGGGDSQLSGCSPVRRRPHLGALNLYGRGPSAFDRWTPTSSNCSPAPCPGRSASSRGSSPHATRGRAATRAGDPGTDRAGEGHADGLHRIDAHQAFQLLRKQSQTTNTRLRDVALNLANKSARQRTSPSTRPPRDADRRCGRGDRRAGGSRRPRRRPTARPVLQTGPGEYGEGDVFIGVRVPATVPWPSGSRRCRHDGVDALLDSPVHEHRLAGLLILVEQFAAVSRPRGRDDGAVSASPTIPRDCPAGTGEQLGPGGPVGHPSSETGCTTGPGTSCSSSAPTTDLWRRRVALVTTFGFIRRGETRPRRSIWRRRS